MGMYAVYVLIWISVYLYVCVYVVEARGLPSVWPLICFNGLGVRQIPY